MSTFEDRVIRLFEQIHPLDRIARAGYVLRGVPEPESVSAHLHFVSVMTLLVLEECPGEFDREKALTMALIHDLCEARLMDIPMPAADKYMREAKDKAEDAITRELFDGFDPKFAAANAEFLAGSSPEARLIRGLDKVQMMVKIIMYQREGRGRLEEFWKNPTNFRDFGIPIVSSLFDALCKEAGKQRPRD